MNRKILLIDESVMLRRIAANILQAQPGHYEVVAATRAAEGFAKACTGGVHLILLDGKSAEGHGAAVCQRLRNDPRTANIPVVVMIGRGMDAPAGYPWPENVVDTLVKPFAPEEISGLVNAIFGFTKVGTTLADLRASLHPLAGAVPPPAGLEAGAKGSDTGARPPVGDYSPLLPEGAGFRLHERAEAYPASSSLKGETRLTSLRAILRSTAEVGLTGVLRFWPGKAEPTEILFDEGRLLTVGTRDGRAYAVHAADVLPGKVSAATLDDAIAEQNATGTPFLLTLGTRGLLSKAAAVALLDQFGQRQFARLWPQRYQPSLRYEFEELENLPNYALRLSPTPLGLDAWLFETTRQLRQEDVTPALRHEGTVGTPLFTNEATGILAGLSLTEQERAFLQRIDPRHDLPATARSLGITQEAAYLLLYRFRCLEVLAYRTAPAAFVMTPRSFLRRVLPLER